MVTNHELRQWVKEEFHFPLTALFFVFTVGFGVSLGHASMQAVGEVRDLAVNVGRLDGLDVSMSRPLQVAIACLISAAMYVVLLRSARRRGRRVIGATFLVTGSAAVGAVLAARFIAPAEHVGTAAHAIRPNEAAWGTLAWVLYGAPVWLPAALGAVALVALARSLRLWRRPVPNDPPPEVGVLSHPGGTSR